jgi:hypothetical protein
MPPTEGKFCDTNRKAIKPQIVVDYSRHMEYMGNGDRIAKCYSTGRSTWKWTKKLFFHVLDLAILNNFILHSCGNENISHRDFRFALMLNMLAHAGLERGIPSPLGRICTIATQVSRLEVSGSKHWPALPCNYAVGCVRPGV